MDESRKQVLRAATVEVVLALRAAYLVADPKRALKHWTQIEERMRFAAKTSTSPEEWVTAMKRGLQIADTSRPLSLATTRLADEVATLGPKGASRWLDMVERELGYIVALTRQEAEDRAEKRRAENTIEMEETES